MKLRCMTYKAPRCGHELRLIVNYDHLTFQPVKNLGYVTFIVRLRKKFHDHSPKLPNTKLNTDRKQKTKTTQFINIHRKDQLL